jgi:hypothetical protein
MGKSPRSAIAEQSRERVVFLDILKQQMLDLEALRKKVDEAERSCSNRSCIKLRDRHLRTSN